MTIKDISIEVISHPKYESGVIFFITLISHHYLGGIYLFIMNMYFKKIRVELNFMLNDLVKFLHNEIHESNLH